MKRKICILFIYSFVYFLFSQEIEPMLKIDYIKHYDYRTDESPFGIFVDEVSDKIDIMNGNWDGGTRISLTNGNEFGEVNDYTSFWADCNIRLGNEIISFSDSLITIQKEKKIYVKAKAESGISFILKKGSGFIVYYIDKNGYPGAVDTTGRIYSSEEAMEYLKEYDSEKYAHSLKRAEELCLKNAFENAEVLVWGKRYYKPIKGGSLYQYDNQGNRYGCNFSWWGNYKNDWGTFCAHSFSSCIVCTSFYHQHLVSEMGVADRSVRALRDAALQ